VLSAVGVNATSCGTAYLGERRAHAGREPEGRRGRSGHGLS
jgi:hypothetical protein